MLQDEVSVYGIRNLSMKTTITSLNQEKENMEDRIEKLQFQVKKHRRESEYKDTETKNYRHREITRMTDYEMQARCLSKQLTEATKELETIQEEREELYTRMIDYEMQAGCLSKQLPEATKELETIKHEREDLLTRMNNHKEEAKNFHKKLQEASNKMETAMQENKDFQIRMNNYKKEAEGLRIKLKDVSNELESTKQENEVLRVGINNHEMEAKGLSKQLSDISKELKIVQGEKENFQLSADKLENQVEELSKQLAEATIGLKTLKQEKDEFLMSFELSQYTSAKLIQDNPNVVDLSDLNRPTKLAEKFSELYDNEWTDGFVVLTNEFNFKEREAIQKLLDILKDAYQYCVKTSKRQDRVIRNALLCPNMDDYQENADQEIEPVQLRNIYDLRKQTSQNAAKNIKQGFIDVLKISELNSPDVPSSCNYVNQCIELCWQMVLRSPPLCLDRTAFLGDDFDKTKYRFYQTSGTKYSYIVWPALYLHENGPLLAKGIAEAI